MKKICVILLLIILLIIAGVVVYFGKNKKVSAPTSNPVSAEPDIKNQNNFKNMGMLKLESSAFQNNQYIPIKYTCDGESVNPPLSVSGVPQSTISLVLILHDPDAPGADGFLHWAVWNIDPATTTIAENSVPAGAVVGNNSAGRTGYYNPCPPSGVHHYNFYLYALDTKLNLPISSTKADIENAMQGHVLDQAVLTGLYSKN